MPEKNVKKSMAIIVSKNTLDMFFGEDARDCFYEEPIETSPQSDYQISVRLTICKIASLK